MGKQMRKKTLVICIGLVFVAASGLYPKSSRRGNQNWTNLHVEVTGLKKVNGHVQATAVVGADILVRSLVRAQDFSETSQTNSSGIASLPKFLTARP